MAAVKRHWALVTAIPLLILAILVAILSHEVDSRQAKAEVSASQPSVAQTVNAPSPNAIAARQAIIAYRRVQQLRTELALQSSDLAAMGISLNSATQILTAVKSFTASSVMNLQSADATYAAAQHSLQEAVRAINVGTADDSTIASLPMLQQNVATAAAQHTAVFAPLISQINGMMTSDQQAIWQAAMANVAAERQPGATPIPAAFKYVAGLTGDQIQQLDMAARQGGTPGQLSAVPQILSSSQAQSAQSAIANQNMQIAAVSAAEANVLPTPPPLMVPRRASAGHLVRGVPQTPLPAQTIPSQ